MGRGQGVGGRGQGAGAGGRESGKAGLQYIHVDMAVKVITRLVQIALDYQTILSDHRTI